MRIRSDISILRSSLTKAVKQVPFAASVALNNTGKVLLVRNRIEMKRQFKDPVPYTLNAFFLRRSNKGNLKASIERKTAPAGKHYLEVQHKGGSRPRKRFETVLERNIPYTKDLQSVIPTARATTTKGGVRMGAVLQTIAGMGGSIPNSPYTTARTKKRRDKYESKKRQEQYFIGYKEDGKNRTDGIYMRTAGGKKVVKLFHLFDYRMSYKPNFPFYEPLRKQASTYFPNQFAKQLRLALRTAR